MSSHEKFSFHTLDEIREKAAALGVDLSFSEDIFPPPLLQPRKVGGKIAPNSMAVLPMEGCDSNPDGSPSELVERRYAGAANLQKKACSFVGLGRSSFAYPDAPHDLMTQGHMEPGKCCITCSLCTQIMRDHGRTGCVVRDGGLYALLYQETHQEAVAREHRAE